MKTMWQCLCYQTLFTCIHTHTTYTYFHIKLISMHRNYKILWKYWEIKNQISDTNATLSKYSMASITNNSQCKFTFFRPNTHPKVSFQNLPKFTKISHHTKPFCKLKYKKKNSKNCEWNKTAHKYCCFAAFNTLLFCYNLWLLLLLLRLHFAVFFFLLFKYALTRTH